MHYKILCSTFFICTYLYILGGGRFVFLLHIFCLDFVLLFQNAPWCAMNYSVPAVSYIQIFLYFFKCIQINVSVCSAYGQRQEVKCGVSAVQFATRWN